MSFDDLNSKSFLEELYRQAKGDMQTQVSMYDVGAAMGLVKAEAGSLAEGLMVEGLIELRTLSGGISITGEGLASLGISAPATPSKNDDQRFSDGPLLNAADREILQRLMNVMKTGVSELRGEYSQLEEIVIDLKTIEIQLLSPAPKLVVIRELLRSLHHSFQINANLKVTATLKPLIT